MLLIGIAKSNHSAALAIEAPAIALRTVGLTLVCLFGDANRKLASRFARGEFTCLAMRISLFRRLTCQTVASVSAVSSAWA
ncbi:hypothetical protein, partial [Mycolicibacterium sp.]|uniref:hypothetical protein n=1 Tax=Mycolicibacterium sp. TaxID=2320850 RepID=UPI0037C93E35